MAEDPVTKFVMKIGIDMPVVEGDQSVAAGNDFLDGPAAGALAPLAIVGLAVFPFANPSGGEHDIRVVHHGMIPAEVAAEKGGYGRLAQFRRHHDQQLHVGSRQMQNRLQHFRFTAKRDSFARSRGELESFRVEIRRHAEHLLLEHLQDFLTPLIPIGRLVDAFQRIGQRVVRYLAFIVVRLGRGLQSRTPS